jgi:hypothetical protein
MKTVTINNFSGGVAEDVREPRTDTFSYASNFDTFSNANRLTPYRTMETESVDSGTLTDFKITDVCVMKDSVNTNIYGLGRVGAADLNPKFFQKSTPMDITSAFQGATGGEDTSYDVIPGTLKEYKNRLFCMSQDGTATYVRAYNHATGAIAAIVTISAYPQVSSGVMFPRPFRHPADDKLYFGSGNVVASYDNSTPVANVGIVLPADCFITSFADYGSYLAIFTAPTLGGGSSKIFLWDVGRALTTPQDIIDLGEGTVAIGENLNGILIAIMSNKTPTTDSAFNIKTKLSVKAYYGGTPEVIKEITTTSNTFTLAGFKSKNNNRLFFACSASLNGTALNQLWVVSKNGTKWSVSPDRLINNDTALTGNINGFSLIGDYLWANFNTATLFRTRLTTATYPTSTYESLINPGMPPEDRTKRKKLVAVSVAKSFSTGQLVVKYRVDSTGAYTIIGTLATGGELVLKSNNESDGIPFKNGYEFQFLVESTLGAEMTELKYTYEEMAEII